MSIYPAFAAPEHQSREAMDAHRRQRIVAWAMWLCRALVRDQLTLSERNADEATVRRCADTLIEMGATQ